MSGQVRVRQAGAVAWLTLSNPGKRNALTWQMYDQLESACTTLDPAVRAVVLRGDGGRAFAAGTDIQQFTEFRTGDDGVAYERRIGRVLDALTAVRVPVLAVVEGPAVGAGLVLAACCDLVVATPDAVFGAPIAHTLGNCLHPAALARLQARLGTARTMAALLTAGLLTAAEAATAGLVARVVERAALDSTVSTLLERIVGGAPLTLAAIKEVDRRLQAAAAAVDADDVLRDCYGSADFREGVRAFLEHRPPRWEGR
jgi:enoyl-CoA hydratase